MKPFTNKYNWERTNFHQKKMIRKKLEKNNRTIALDVLYAKKEEIYPACVLKHNSNREKQVFLLMIPNGEGWHYPTVKKLSALLRGITSKHKGGFYCLGCLHYFATGNKDHSHKNVYENKDFCNIVMPSEDNKLLEFNQYQKPDKVLFIIHADPECLIEKIDGCKNNTENSSTTKTTNILFQFFQCPQYRHLKA